MKRLLVAVGAAFIFCGASMSAETQIVVQWLDENTDASFSVDMVEFTLEEASDGSYFVDGHDMGSGTTNVFLYAEDAAADRTVARIISLFEQKKLPADMRIGKAVYQDAERRNWVFQPMYPPGLTHFDIMYPDHQSAPK